MRSCQIVILLKYKRQSDFLSYNIHFFGCSTDSFSVVSKEKWNQVSLRRVSQQMPNISSCKMSLVAAPQWRHGWDSTQLENKTQHQQRREERAFKAEETLRASGLLSLQCISGVSLISPCSEFNSLCRAKIVTWKKTSRVIWIHTEPENPPCSHSSLSHYIFNCTARCRQEQSSGGHTSLAPGSLQVIGFSLMG